MQSNRVTKLENLEELKNLEEIYLGHNGIPKIEGLEKNVGLLAYGTLNPSVAYLPPSRLNCAYST
jgi:Leucine-rich repeat (LRR) protein